MYHKTNVNKDINSKFCHLRMMKIRTSRLFDNFDDQLMHLVAQQSTVLGSFNVFVAHSLNSPDFWSHTRTHYSRGRSQFNSVTVHFGQRDSSGLE